MGGGKTRRKEVAKQVRGFQEGTGSSRTGQAGPEPHICEKEQTIAFRATQPIAVGSVIGVSRANPPAVVLDGKPVGTVSDRRQSATLNACLDDGYRISGTVVAFNDDVNDGLAAIIGVR